MSKYSNVTQLASFIAKKEGKKLQVPIGNIREILGIVSDEMVINSDLIWKILWNNGAKRKSRSKSK